MLSKQPATETLSTTGVLSHSSKRPGSTVISIIEKSFLVVLCRQLYELTKQTTIVRCVSINISFRARIPSCFGLIFEIRDVHSLPYALVKIGLVAPDLSTSAKVNSEKVFKHKSVRVRWTRGWRS